MFIKPLLLVFYFLAMSSSGYANSSRDCLPNLTFLSEALPPLRTEKVGLDILKTLLPKNASSPEAVREVTIVLVSANWSPENADRVLGIVRKCLSHKHLAPEDLDRISYFIGNGKLKIRQPYRYLQTIFRKKNLSDNALSNLLKYLSTARIVSTYGTTKPGNRTPVISEQHFTAAIRSLIAHPNANAAIGRKVITIAQKKRVGERLLGSRDELVDLARTLID